jgi:hypothetical protein
MLCNLKTQIPCGNDNKKSKGTANEPQSFLRLAALTEGNGYAMLRG